jgi:hypothetical protein
MDAGASGTVRTGTWKTAIGDLPGKREKREARYRVVQKQKGPICRLRIEESSRRKVLATGFLGPSYVPADSAIFKIGNPILGWMYSGNVKTGLILERALPDSGKPSAINSEL